METQLTLIVALKITNDVDVTVTGATAEIQRILSERVQAAVLALQNRRESPARTARTVVTEGPSRPITPQRPARREVTAGPSGTEIQAGPSGTEIQAGPSGTEIQAGPSGTEIQAGPSGTEIQAGPSGAVVAQRLTVGRSHDEQSTDEETVQTRSERLYRSLIAKNILQEYSESNHPGIPRVVKEAILEIHEPNGSSLQAIMKYLNINYQFTDRNFKIPVKKYIDKAVKKGVLIKTNEGETELFKLAPIIDRRTRSTCNRPTPASTSTDAVQSTSQGFKSPLRKPMINPTLPKKLLAARVANEKNKIIVKSSATSSTASSSNIAEGTKRQRESKKNSKAASTSKEVVETKKDPPAKKKATKQKKKTSENGESVAPKNGVSRKRKRVTPPNTENTENEETIETPAKKSKSKGRKKSAPAKRATTSKRKTVPKKKRNSEEEFQ